MKRFADFKKLQRHTYLKLKGIQIARLAWRRNLRVCKLTLSQATWEKRERMIGNLSWKKILSANEGSQQKKVVICILYYLE